jgi:hypothetical protein
VRLTDDLDGLDEESIEPRTDLQITERAAVRRGMRGADLERPPVGRRHAHDVMVVCRLAPDADVCDSPFAIWRRDGRVGRRADERMA